MLTREQIDKIKNTYLRKQLLEHLAQNPVESFAETPAGRRTAEAPVPSPIPSPVVSVVASAPIIPSLPNKSTSKFNKLFVLSFRVAGAPMAKPRMTQRDRWQKRPVVLRYREYCDRIRAAAAQQIGVLPPHPIRIMVAAHLALPESWSKKKRLALLGQAHRSRPDWDNIGKSICDALLEEDSCVAGGTVDKFWCWCPSQEKTEITLFYERPACPACGSIMIGGLCQNYGCSSS